MNVEPDCRMYFSELCSQRKADIAQSDYANLIGWFDLLHERSLSVFGLVQIRGILPAGVLWSWYQLDLWVLSQLQIMPTIVSTSELSM